MNQPNVRPIICGTDLSEPAQHAGNVAAALAKRLGTQLLLVHGIGERGEIPAHHWPRLIAEDRPRLTSEAERLRRTGASVEERLVSAVPDSGVARCAEKADARMIIVASSGLGAAGRWLMGSISERIAETAWVPTLVVRDAAVLEAWLRDDRPLKIFVGADFAATSDAAMRWVEELTKIAPCEVTVGYVDRKAEERGEQALHSPAGAPPTPEMQEMLTHDLREKARVLYGKHEVHVHVLSAADRVDLRLIELAREANADLIVVGTHQWHGLSRLRHASVSRRVLDEAKANVACVPAHTLTHGANAQIPKVLAATDLSTHGGHAVPYACSMLEAGGEVRGRGDHHREPRYRRRYLRSGGSFRCRCDLHRLARAFGFARRGDGLGRAGSPRAELPARARRPSTLFVNQLTSPHSHANNTRSSNDRGRRAAG